MARRLVTKIRYFNGDNELDAATIRRLPVAEVEQSEAGNILPRYADKDAYWAAQNGPRVSVGKLPRKSGEPLSADAFRWHRVERTVQFKTTPDPHKCDWRCLGARPGGGCECECGGRNHGREFVCS